MLAPDKVSYVVMRVVSVELHAEFCMATHLEQLDANPSYVFLDTLGLQGKPYQAGGFKPVGSPRIATGPPPSQFHPTAPSAFMPQQQASSSAAFMPPGQSLGGYPGMAQPQAPAPTPQPAAPPAPTGPPANVNIVNVDTSKVPPCSPLLQSHVQPICCACDLDLLHDHVTYSPCLTASAFYHDTSTLYFLGLVAQAQQGSRGIHLPLVKRAKSHQSLGLLPHLVCLYRCHLR